MTILTSNTSQVIEQPTIRVHGVPPVAAIQWGAVRLLLHPAEVDQLAWLLARAKEEMAAIAAEGAQT